MFLRLSGWALLTAIATFMPQTALAQKPRSANTAAISPAYAHDLAVIIEALQYYETLFAVEIRSDMDPVQREFIEFFRQEATREELVSRFMPNLASVLNPPLASRLAQLMNSPVFRKNMTLIRLKQNEAHQYTAQENAELAHIWSDPAMKTFEALLPKVKVSLHDTYKRWSKDFNKQLHSRSAAILEKLVQDLEEARHARDGRIVTIGSIGYAPLDEYNNALGAGAILISTAYAQFEDVQMQADYSDYLGLYKLVDKTRLQGASRAIDQVEEAWGTAQAQLDAAFVDLEANITNRLVNFVAGLRARVTKQYAAMRKELGSQDVAMRRLFAEHREIVRFMQANQDGISQEDGSLIFANKELLQRADALDDQFDVTTKELEEIAARLEAVMRGDVAETPVASKNHHHAPPPKRLK